MGSPSLDRRQSFVFSLHVLVPIVPLLMPEMAPCGVMTWQRTSLSPDAGRIGPLFSLPAGARGLCLPCAAVRVIAQLNGWPRGAAHQLG